MGREAAPSVARARRRADYQPHGMLQGASAARFFGRDGKPTPPPSTGWCAAPSVHRLVVRLPGLPSKGVQRAQIRLPGLVTRAPLAAHHITNLRPATPSFATAARLSTPSPRHSHTNTMDLRPPRLYKWYKPIDEREKALDMPDLTEEQRAAMDLARPPAPSLPGAPEGEPGRGARRRAGRRG